MATPSDSLIRRTQKGLSILAFETTKQSRILKKRMRAVALQKEIKADLRDLGNLVYNAVINKQKGILDEEEVSILVENIRANKDEVERLRDAVARLGRTRKHFLDQEDEEFDSCEVPEPKADEEPSLVVEPAQPASEPATDEGVATPQELEGAIVETAPAEPAGAEESAEKAKPKSKPQTKSKAAKKKAEVEPLTGSTEGTEPESASASKK